jgi:hypothetical protein
VDSRTGAVAFLAPFEQPAGTKRQNIGHINKRNSERLNPRLLDRVKDLSRLRNKGTKTGRAHLVMRPLHKLLYALKLAGKSVCAAAEQVRALPDQGRDPCRWQAHDTRQRSQLASADAAEREVSENNLRDHVLRDL